MKAYNQRFVAVILATLRFIFALDTLITLLFLGGIAIVLYTVSVISMLAFGFALGVVLIGLAVLLNLISTKA